MAPRTSPASSDAEQALLGSIFLDPKRSMTACLTAGVKGEHFHFPGHAIVFDILLEFWNDNEPLDSVVITEALHARGTLNTCGGRIGETTLTGPAFITALAIHMPTAANVGEYIGIVKKKATRRTIIDEAIGITTGAYDPGIADDELFSDAEAALLKIVAMREGQKTHTRDIKELVLRATTRLQNAIDGDGTIAMPYGIKELDYETQGLRAPELTIISAKSSDGKSALALNVTEELAIKRGKRVGIISLEMSDDQCADRLLGSVAWVDTRKIKRERAISDDETQKIARAAARIADAKIFIRDDGQLSISEIGATFAAWKAQHGLDVGIIDHIQLVRGDGNSDGRTEEVERISRSLKPMAKRLGIALIVLSQVTEDTKAGTYSTKNSKAIGEDADNLLNIHHKLEDGAWHSFIRIDKQRDGERNLSIPVAWIPKLQRFASRAKEAEPELPLNEKNKARK